MSLVLGFHRRIPPVKVWADPTEKKDEKEKSRKGYEKDFLVRIMVTRKMGGGGRGVG